MTKKKKSVERTKQKKSNAEIIQVKQPLSNGIQNANSNKNTQIVQVIFPPDTEIRKRKKKRKGKSQAQKKREKEKEELLEELKSKLQDYDNLQAEAQQLKIQIPEEIAISVINEADLKKNEDIQNYINDVIAKIRLLQALLEKSQIPPEPQGLPMRLGAGIMTLPNQPALRPQQEYPSPQPPSPQPPSPQQPKTPESDKTKEALDRLAREIQEKIGKDKKILPPPKTIPIEPLQPLEPIDEKDLEKFKGIIIGNKQYDITTPKGWDLFYNRYRIYLKRVDDITKNGEITKGVFHIPLEKSIQLNNTRNTFRTDYLKWYDGLSPNIKEYMKRDKLVNTIHTEMGINTGLSVKEFARTILSLQKIKVNELTEGNEKPALEQRIQDGGKTPFKDDKDNKDYQNYINKLNVNTNKLITIQQRIQILDNPSQIEIDALYSRINILQTNITNVFSSLSQEDKIGVGTAQDKIIKRFNDVRISLKQLEPEIVVDNPLPVPRIPNEANIRKKNLSILNKFQNKENPSITKKVEGAIEKILGEEVLERVKRIKKQKDKVEMIKTEYNIYKANNRPVMVNMDNEGMNRIGADANLPDAGANLPDGGMVF